MNSNTYNNMKTNSLLFMISSHFNGVFGDEVKMSVREGDSVTLHTDLTDMKKVIKIIWRFGEEGAKSFLVEIYADKTIGVNYNDTDERFKDRLQVNNQTGDLTIKNMKIKHSELYEAEINSYNTGTTYKNVRVTVGDSPPVIDARTGDVKSVSVSVSEGESVTLHNDLNDIQNDTLIMWRFGNEGLLIAKKDKEDNMSSVYDDERFRGRLKLDDHTGSLTIAKTKTTDAGVYKLNISSNNKILFMTFNVSLNGAVACPDGCWCCWLLLCILVVTTSLV